MNEAHELNLPIDTLVRRLRSIPEYAQDFNRVYQRMADPLTVTQALKSFQLSLLSASSRYDRFRYRKDSTALTPAASRGMQLFFSEATFAHLATTAPISPMGFFIETEYLNSDDPIPDGHASVWIGVTTLDFARLRSGTCHSQHPICTMGDSTPSWRY